MDKIFHSTFDFFTHVLPGFAVLCAFFIMFPEMNYPQQYLELAGKMNIGSGVFVLVASYLIGFAINPIGRWIYKTVNKTIDKYGVKIVTDEKTKQPRKVFKLFFLEWFSGEPYQNIDLFISDKFVLIRELNPANFRYVETCGNCSAITRPTPISGGCCWLLRSCVSLFSSTGPLNSASGPPTT